MRAYATAPRKGSGKLGDWLAALSIFLGLPTVILNLSGGVGPQMIEDIERHTGFDQHGAGFVV